MKPSQKKCKCFKLLALLEHLLCVLRVLWCGLIKLLQGLFILVLGLYWNWHRGLFPSHVPHCFAGLPRFRIQSLCFSMASCSLCTSLPLTGAKPRQVDIDRRQSHQHSVSQIPSIYLCWWHSCEHSCCLCSLHACFHFVSGEGCAVQCCSLGLAPAVVACETP